MYTERLTSYISSGTLVDEAEVVNERIRILNLIAKPCPHDFPKELKHLWKNNLEFSLTPYQSGWIQLMKKKTKK